MQFWKKKQEFCILCKRELQHKYKPYKEWKINGMLCSDCHIIKTKEYIVKQQIEKEKKDKEFEKERNYCSICGTNLRFIRYNPKPKWNMSGQLCRKCWDQRNEIQ